MRLRTLNGAPLREDLNFGADNLIAAEAVSQYLYGEPVTTRAGGSTPELKWRRLADTRLRSGWSQPYLPAGAFHGSDPNASFSIPDIGEHSELPTEDTTMLDDTVTLLDDTVEPKEFVHHSLMFHDTLLSSQIAREDAEDRPVSSASFMDTSFQTADSESQLFEASHQGPILHVPSTLVLTPLGSLPSADHLRSIYPQTPTPNILCVLTSAAVDRELFVKKGGYKMTLREIDVADDTKSGFRISFWHRPSAKGDTRDILTKTLDGIRVGDVLMLRNIALNAFRDDVYGQSLNPSITRVRTTIEVLLSGRGMSSRQLGALPPAVVTAFMRIKRWANVHVAPDTTGLKKRKGTVEASSRFTKRSLRSSDTHDDDLPPDTMESTR